MIYGAVPTLRDMTAERPRFEILAEDGGADERTLVLARGDSFALFDRHGDFTPSSSGRHGLFFDGTRFLSALMLRLARRRPLLLSSSVRTANQGLAIHLANPDLIDPDAPRVPRETLYLYRSIELEDGGCRFGIALRSFDERSLELELELAFAADFADVFEVRGAHRPRRGQFAGPELRTQGVTLTYTGLDRRERRTELAFSRAPETLGPDFARFRLEVGPGRPSALELVVRCELGGERGARAPRFSLPGAPRRSAPAALLPSSSNPAFDQWARRSAHDLAMLTVETAQGPFPYAGVPWFATPFGRDSLITAYSVLWLDPGLARGVLRFLASHQAQAASRAEDAEPGKIVHEMRGGEMAALGEIPFGRYYGSVDVTPCSRCWPPPTTSAPPTTRSRASSGRTSSTRWRGSTDPAIRTTTVSSSTGSARATGCRTTAGRIRATRSCTPTARSPRARSRSARCRRTSTARSRGSRASRARLGHERAAERLERDADALRERFERAFWCEELGTLRARARRRQAALPRAQLERRPRAARPGIARPSTRARSRTRCSRPIVLGLGRAHARGFGPALQPDVVPQRLGLAARQRARSRTGLARYGATAGAERIFGALFEASLLDGRAACPSCCAASTAAGRSSRRSTRSRARRRPGRPAASSCSCSRCCGSRSTRLGVRFGSRDRRCLRSWIGSRCARSRSTAQRWICYGSAAVTRRRCRSFARQGRSSWWCRRREPRGSVRSTARCWISACSRADGLTPPIRVARRPSTHTDHLLWWAWARRCISSGGISSICVANDHVWPKGSLSTPKRSP